MRDSKKILIFANALVVLFLLLSTYVFIYSMINPVDVDYRIINFKNKKTNSVNENLENNRQEIHNSIDNLNITERINILGNKFENLNKNYNKKCNLLDHLLNLNSLNVSNIEYNTNFKYQSNSNKNKFDGIEGIIFYNNSDQQSDAIFDFTNMDRLYNLSVLTQIGYAFALSGLYTNYVIWEGYKTNPGGQKKWP